MSGPTPHCRWSTCVWMAALLPILCLAAAPAREPDRKSGGKPQAKPSDAPPARPERIKFQSPEHHFTATYPTDWSEGRTPAESMVMLLVPAPPPGQEQQALSLTTMIFVWVEAPEGGGKPTLDQLQQTTVSNYKAAAPDAELVSAEPAKLAGEPARRLTLKGHDKSDRSEVRSVAIVCVHGNVGYTVACAAPAAGFDAPLRAFETVASSFRFTDASDKKAPGSGAPGDGNTLPF